MKPSAGIERRFLSAEAPKSTYSQSLIRAADFRSGFSSLPRLNFQSESRLIRSLAEVPGSAKSAKLKFKNSAAKSRMRKGNLKAIFISKIS